MSAAQMNVGCMFQQQQNAIFNSSSHWDGTITPLSYSESIRNLVPVFRIEFTEHGKIKSRKSYKKNILYSNEIQQAIFLFLYHLLFSILFIIYSYSHHMYTYLLCSSPCSYRVHLFLCLRFLLALSYARFHSLNCKAMLSTQLLLAI